MDTPTTPTLPTLLRNCADCLESDMQPTAAELARAAAERIETDALKIAALKGEIRGLRYGVRVGALVADPGEPAP